MPFDAFLWWTGVWAFVLLVMPLSAMLGPARSMTAALAVTIGFPIVLMVAIGTVLERRRLGWLAMPIIIILALTSLAFGEARYLRENGREIQATFVQTHMVGKGKGRTERCQVHWGGDPGTVADIDRCPASLRDAG
ncbi:hypothetical protein ACFQ07_16920, partial [Actinomadura adrarensis]